MVFKVSKANLVITNIYIFSGAPGVSDRLPAYHPGVKKTLFNPAQGCIYT